MRGLQKIIILLLLGLVFQTSAHAKCEYPFRIARNAGFTDSQIIGYLKNRPATEQKGTLKAEIEAAQNRGATDRDLIDYLITASAGEYCGEDLGTIREWFKNVQPITATTDLKGLQPIPPSHAVRLEQTDLTAAFLLAVWQTGWRLLGSALLFFALSYGVYKKTRDTKLKMGRWVAAWFAAAAVVSIRVSTVDEVVASIAQVVITGLMGFLIGCAWGAFRPILPTQPHPVPEAKISDVFYERALAEYSTDRRDSGMWARLFATHDGDENKVKAAYIKERAEVLSQRAQ